MRARAILWSALLPLPIFSAYTYYFTDNLTSINLANWWQNGTLTAGAGGLTSADANGGSLISKVAVPDGSSEYEVRTVLALASPGGTYIHYLRATSDARSGPVSSGTYYAVELQNPAFNGAVCTATLAFYKRVGGVTTLLGSGTVACRSGMAMRSVRMPDRVHVYFDQTYVSGFVDSSIAAGTPGIGVRAAPAGNAIAQVQLGPLDRVAPSPVSAQSIGTSIKANEVSLQWQGAPDDANGIGVWHYRMFRNGQWMGEAATAEFTDATVAPASTYTYDIYVADQHFIALSPATSITVTTPPALAVDPRRTGVRPTGHYWGAMGEQIDLLSGNLNFTLPLVKAMSRNGAGVTFALNYNSQNWRRDGATHWKLGRDVGYGFGWKLLAGSVTAYWTSLFNVHHFVFTDATGAEYRLDVNQNGIWTTSKDSLYVWYDPATYKLYFPDGSFWIMGAASGGSEQDAGTRYPTQMQDSNGNQILIRYLWGLNAVYAQSSARIDQIEDVRAIQAWPTQVYYTYTFTYNSDAITHLTGITSHVGSGENYSFGYSGAFALNSPFPPYPSFGTAQTLVTATVNGLNLSHTFEYDAAGSGELTKAIFPYGGELHWTHRSFTYVGDRTLREVQHRYLVQQAGAAPLQYSIGRDDALDATRSMHRWAQVADPTGTSKVWWFNWNTGSVQEGLIEAIEDRETGNTPGHSADSFAWIVDPVGRLYVQTAVTTLDPGKAYQKQSKVEQALDSYGNLLTRNVYDYGNLATPKWTYTNTYLNSADYTTRYIYNRLSQATVTAGAETFTLAWNTYDGGPPADRAGLRQHDRANYGTSFLYRGNASIQRRYGAADLTVACDITGTPSSTYDGWLSTTVTPTSNNAVPGVLAPGGNANLAHTLQWSSFLGLTQDSGPNQAATTIYYDAYARKSQVTSPHGAVTTYAYTNSPPTDMATTNGRWTRTTRDGLGRAIKLETGNGSTTVSIVDTEYDACACSPLGKVKRVSQPYAPGGTVYWTTYTYDSLGRTLSAALPNGAGTTTYLYEGNTVTVTDPAGKWRRFTLDTQGNLVKVTEPNPAGGDWDTLYTYNGAGQLSQVSMTRAGATQTRSFTYLNGKIQMAANPESGTTTYTWSQGRLTAKNDAKGNYIQYTYETYGRLSEVRRWPAGSGEDPNQKTKYYYDSNPFDGTFTQYGWSRLAAVEYWAKPSSGRAIAFQDMFSYTRGGAAARHRMGVTAPVPGSTSQTSTAQLETSYTVDNEGRRTAMAYPGYYKVQPNGSFLWQAGKTFTYGYDTMGRPNRMTEQGASDWVASVSYNTAGQMTAMSYLGASETRGYNVLGQLTSLANLGINFTYTYAAAQNNGRILQAKDWITGEEVNYQYDALNRLVSASTTGPEWGVKYAHDGFGNLYGRTPVAGKQDTAPYLSLGINPATNRIVGQSYDANGNALVLGNYDVENRLIGYVSGPEYGYNHANRRVYKKRPLGGGQYAEELIYYDPAGPRLGTYEMRWQGTTTKTLRLVQTDVCYYFGAKLIQVNTERVSLDRLGSVAYRGGTRYRYFPYGEERGTPPPHNRDKFATYYRDAETGLDYANQRYYSSTWGRFLTPDPYQASGGPKNPLSWNRYAYVVGDPLNYYDPNGLQEKSPLLGHCDLNPWDPICQSQLPLPGSIQDVPDDKPPYEEVQRRIQVTGFSGARARLGTERCALFFGFSSGKDAQSSFDRLTTRYHRWGGPEVEVVDGRRSIVPPADRWGPSAARSFDSTNTIEINLDYGWFQPDAVLARNTATGQTEAIDFLGAVSDGIFGNSDSRLSLQDYQTLVILHEFRHLRGAPQERGSSGFNREIYEQCLRP